MSVEMLKAAIRSVPILHRYALRVYARFQPEYDALTERFRLITAEIPKIVPEPVFVKVGANDGVTADLCADILLAGTAWRGVLIEPVPHCVERLRANYPDTGRFRIKQAAVGSPAGTATFYYVDQRASEVFPGLHSMYDQLGSFSRDHILKFMDGRLEPYIVGREVEVRPLSSILEEAGVGDVHLLHIDTEGHDFEVLKTLDFGAHAPWVIFVEHTHVPPAQKPVMLRLLQDNGYAVHDCQRDYLALRKNADKRLMRIFRGAADAPIFEPGYRGARQDRSGR